MKGSEVMMKSVLERIESIQKEIDYSGTAYVKSGEDILIKSYGYSNRGEKIMNEKDTRYGIASGSKLFTSIAIGQLVDKKIISFDMKLIDCLDCQLPFFDKNVTIHHLLTHTAGIPDYFDEAIMNDFEDLWILTPMYRVRDLQDFLPLFQGRKMVSAPGEQFHYNNAGYIILGLIIEQASGLKFSNYIEQFILKKAGMLDSGYFELDALPEKTAMGYIQNQDGSYKTNIYSIPAKGGADGGIFVTAEDMASLWASLNNGELMSCETTKRLLKHQVHVEKDIYYGYAGYMQVSNDYVEKHILMGYDPGVNFRSVYYRGTGLTIIVLSNKNDGAYEILRGIEETIVD